METHEFYFLENKRQKYDDIHHKNKVRILICSTVKYLFGVFYLADIFANISAFVFIK